MHTIYYKKLSTNATTIYVRVNKTDLSIIKEWLTHSLNVLGEASYEHYQIRNWLYEPLKELGKGKRYKKQKFNSIMSVMCGILEQHNRTKPKDLSIYQIRNCERLLKCFQVMHLYLKKQGWPSQLIVPSLNFVDIEDK